MMFQYFKNFLSERCICTRVGKTYSSNKTTDMGIPQSSVIAPILVNIIIHDLPKVLSNNTHVALCADDIAIWVNTTLRKHINKRVVNHVQKLYQLEINKLTAYMKDNGFELSREKTCLMLFNNGENPKSLPQIELDGQLLNYKQNTKFLGVSIITKLNWRLHIENLINKARKRLNFLKIVSTQFWSQDTKVLLHLSISLVRSKLIYGQEVYFSAPITLLKKLQSKAIKLAISVPVHTNTSKFYAEAGIISLSEQRKLEISKYVIRSLAVINSVTEELFIDSNKDYPKSAQNISSIQPIRNYINDLINEYNIDIKSIPVLPTSPQMSQWEHINARFDTDYTDLKKSESTDILAPQVREHLNNKYLNHIKILTDNSVLDSLDSVAGFVVPELKVQKSFYLSPFLTGRMFVRPNILRTLRRTMIRFLIEHLVRRIWFGQSRLYFILNWLVMRCKLRPELAADAQQTA